MYLPIISFLFLIPPLLTLMATESRPMAPLPVLLCVVTALPLIMTTLGYLSQKKGKPNLFVKPPFMLGYTAVFILSALFSFTLSSFSSLSLAYAMVVLSLYSYALYLHLPYSPKSLVFLSLVSLISLVASLACIPFSVLLLLFSALPLGGFVFEKNKRKEKATASKQSLQSMLAHEIRTPLTVMQTTTGLLLEEVPGALNAKQKQFVKSNYEYTQRLITFSENMLTQLKFEREFDLKKKEKVNIRLITQDIVTFFGPMLQIKNQSIRYSFPSLLSTPVGDESLIRQVFINLVHNAVKHTKEGGYIVISVTQDDEQVVVSISDNGQGIEGEGRENLFREFYQEKDANEHFQDGFGLGLSIVRQIIQRHGGKVYITSVKDKGTIVSFTLPAKAIR